MDPLNIAAKRWQHNKSKQQQLDEVCDDTIEEGPTPTEYWETRREQVRLAHRAQERRERDRLARERREELQRRLEIAIANRPENQDPARWRAAPPFDISAEDLPDEDF